MSGDFGPYGKGFDGYVHYTQAFDEAKRGGGDGRKPSSNGGCLTNITLLFIAFALVLACLL
jgi:hypothetical protein